MGQSSNFGKVLIAGGGIGGLTLAQALHRNNVPFEVFERDEAPTGRKQGWAVALVESVSILESILPEQSAKNLYTVGVHHNTGDYDEFGFVDIRSGELVALTGGKPLGEPESLLRANRAALRSFLWKENGLPVVSGKQFTHYEEDESGVVAFFKDGTSSRGSLLIGADGLHSHITDQLIGQEDHKPVVSDYVPLFGEVDLNRNQYEPLVKLGNAGFLASGPGLRLYFGLLTIEDDRSSGRFFWALMRYSEHPKTLSDWIQNATAQQRYDFAIETCNTCNVHPSLKAAFELGGLDAIIPYQPKFLEFVTPDNLPQGRTTILGDAAHGMLPFRGLGANTAILDANDLAVALIQAYKDDADASSIVPKYLEKMIPRGREAVLSSRAGGTAAMDNPAMYFKNFLREKS